MSSSPPFPDRAADYADDLAVALRLAAAADELTMSRFGASDLVVEAKPDLTPVSDADRATEQLIRAGLAADRPHDAVSGEEFGTTGSGARRWVLDPIDGTKNYVRGVPVWATLIALLVDDDPVLGVVSAPALGRRWWAHRDGGAWLAALGAEPRRLRVSAVGELGDASFSHSSVEGWAEHGRSEQFHTLSQSVWRTRGYGDFWSYMLVAEGSVDIAAEPELELWDVAALAPVVIEAGGRLTGIDGVPGVHQRSAAASNGRLHDALLAQLRL
ncbi:MAG: histidinol-phosphatase [Jatrophihabitans sp.]